MMKKAVSVCMTAVLAATLMAGGAVQAFAAAPVSEPAADALSAENCLSGRWERASSPELTESVTTLFDKAFEGLVGASYTPTALLATRLTTNGRQYRVLCRQTMVYPGAQEVYVVVTLQRGWFGQASIVEIGDAIDFTDLMEEAMGGWQEPESPVLTDAATTAFQKATDGLVGVNYVPVALLSTQVVAGTNYRILCEATVVYPGEQMHYVVMTLYEDLDGNVSVLDVTDQPNLAS